MGPTGGPSLADAIRPSLLATGPDYAGRVRIPRPAPGRGKIWVLATVLLLGATAVAIWWGLAATLTKPNWTTITWDIRSDREIEVMYQVSKPAEMTVQCVVEASGADHALVGSREVTIGPQPDRERTYRTVLRTTAPAIAGKLRNCREIDAG